MKVYSLVFLFLVFCSQLLAQSDLPVWTTCQQVPQQGRVDNRPIPLNVTSVNEWLLAEPLSDYQADQFELRIRILVSGAGTVVDQQIISNQETRIPSRVTRALVSLRFVPGNRQYSPVPCWMEVRVEILRGFGKLSFIRLPLPDNFEAVYRELQETIQSPVVTVKMAVSHRGKIRKLLIDQVFSSEERKRVEAGCQRFIFPESNSGAVLEIPIYKVYPEVPVQAESLVLEPYNPLKEEEPGGYHGLGLPTDLPPVAYNLSALMACQGQVEGRREQEPELLTYRVLVSENGEAKRIVGTLGDKELLEQYFPCFEQISYLPAYWKGEAVERWLNVPIEVCRE